jgi:hypothetical protein
LQHIAQIVVNRCNRTVNFQRTLQIGPRRLELSLLGRHDARQLQGVKMTGFLLENVLEKLRCLIPSALLQETHTCFNTQGHGVPGWWEKTIGGSSSEKQTLPKRPLEAPPRLRHVPSVQRHLKQ